MQCNAAGVVEAALCWVTMSRAVSHQSKRLYRSYHQGRDATVQCLWASIDDEVVRSVVVHLFLRSFRLWHHQRLQARPSHTRRPGLHPGCQARPLLQGMPGSTTRDKATLTPRLRRRPNSTARLRNARIQSQVRDRPMTRSRPQPLGQKCVVTRVMSKKESQRTPLPRAA